MPSPYASDIDAERIGWYEIADLVRSLTPVECVVAGYYTDPDWSVRDLVTHLGTWLAEAQIQFERMRSGTYEGHDIDIDAMNATFLEGMRGQAWDVCWLQATAGRTRMIQTWEELTEPSEDAAWWIRKSGPDHYRQHVDRLREWAAELIGRRPGSGVR